MKIKAVFDNYINFKKALTSLYEAGHRQYEVFSPIDPTDIEYLMPKKGSTVHIYALIGALSGMALFFFMCIYASQLFGQVVGGKPPVSRIPFTIVTYEGTILFGAVTAFITAMILARLRPGKPSKGYDPRFTADNFGIEVSFDAGRREQVIELLKSAGAIEVNEIE